MSPEIYFFIFTCTKYFIQSLFVEKNGKDEEQRKEDDGKKPAKNLKPIIRKKISDRENIREKSNTKEKDIPVYDSNYDRMHMKHCTLQDADLTNIGHKYTIIQNSQK